MADNDPKIEQMPEELVDNTSDINQVKANIDDLKTSVTTLQQEIEAFDKQKKDLAKEILEQKQKEIEQKKLEIENKKKETQELIDKIRKERIDLKLENLDDLAKQTFEEQRSKEEELLVVYEKDLKAIEPMKKTFWDKTKEIGNKVWEWTKEHKKPLLIASGIGIAIRGISRLFRRKKEKSEGDEEDNKKRKKKKFRNRWYGKALKWGLIGTGIWYLGKGLLSGKWNMFGLGKDDKNPESPGNGLNIPGQTPNNANEFEKLPDTIKETYNAFGNGINEFYSSVYTQGQVPGQEVLGSSDFEKTAEGKAHPGMIPLILDARYESVKDMLSESAIFYEIYGSKGVALFDTLKSKGIGFMQDMITPLFKGIDAVSYGLLSTEKNVDKYMETLKNTQDSEAIIRLAFRKSIKTFAYLQNRKNALQFALAREKLNASNIDGFNQKSQEDQNDQIEDALSDEKFYNDNIKDQFEKGFMNANLLDTDGNAGALLLLQKYNLMNGELSDRDQQKLDDIEKDKNDILGENYNDMKILIIKDNLQQGRLTTEGQEELQSLTEEFSDHMQDVGSKSWYSTYLPIIDMFKPESATFEQILEGTGYHQYVDVYKKQIDIINEKSKLGTLKEQDLDDLKNNIDDYFSLQKELALGTNYVQEIREENGSLTLLYGFTFIKGGETIFNGVKMVVAGDSWTKRGEGLLMTAGGFATVDLMSLPFRSVFSVVRGRGLAYSPTFSALKWTTRKSFNLVGLRSKAQLSYISPYLSSKLYANYNHLFYDVLKGRVSLERAVDIAKHMKVKGNSAAAINETELLRELFPNRTDYVSLAEKFKNYGKNKYILNQLFEKGHYSREILSPKDRFKLDKSKMRRKINTDFLGKLDEIDGFLGRCTHAGKSELVKGFLETTKTLRPDMIKELLATQTFDKLTVEASRDIGKLLGKNMHKFSSLDDFKAFQGFFARNYPSNTSKTFVANSLSKRRELKVMDHTAQTKYIETGELNTSLLDRRINAMKDNFRKSSKTLRNLVKEGKTPYPSSVESTANSLDDIAKASNEDLALLAESERMGSGSWLGSMSKDVTLMKKLSPLFKDKAFVKLLSSAKTQQAVKEIFASKGITNVPDEFVVALSKTSSTKKLVDTMRYVEKFETLGKLGRILQQPAMKYAARVVGRVFVVGTIILGGVLAYDTYQEGSRIAKTNKERGELMQNESFFDIGLTAAGACAFIPGIGWVAAGVIIILTTLASVVKESVFDTLDKYNKNYKDFIYSAPLSIKQHVLTTILGSSEEDRGFGDWFVGIGGPDSKKIMETLAAKTGSEGVKALLYAEEWKKNWLAMIDIDDKELVDELAKENPPITRAQIAAAKDEVEKNVEARYAYLKKKCGVYVLEGKTYINIKKIVSVDKIKSGEGLKLLDQLMLESEYAITNPELFGDPKKIEQQKKEAKDILGQDTSKFKLLEKLFEKDRQSLLYMYRYLNNFAQHLEQFGFDADGVCIESEYDVITKNIEYFDNYMMYKTLDQGIDVALYSAGYMQPNFTLTRDFFVGFSLDNPVANKELYTSKNKLQTILYRIATEVIGIRINNTVGDIKNVFHESNEKMYGIYFDDNKLSVNGNYFGDTEYTGTDIETIKKIRADIEQKMADGDLIDVGTGDTYLNKEIGNKYLAIIDQELARI